MLMEITCQQKQKSIIFGQCWKTTCNLNNAILCTLNVYRNIKKGWNNVSDFYVVTKIKDGDINEIVQNK